MRLFVPFILLQILLASSALMTIPRTAASAECLRPGEVLITPENRAAATAGGTPENYPCWIPGQPYLGQDAGQAKQYLRQILCKSNGDSFGGAGPDGTIQNLNPQFAVCAAQFLKFANETLGVPTCIKEGFRTVQKQNEYVARGAFACRYGAQCEHPRGIAIDVNTGSRAGYARLHENACQFGVDFYLRFDDQYHFVPLSHSIQRGKSSCKQQIQTNCLTPGFTPKDMGFGTVPTQSPVSRFTESIRQALGLSTQQPASTQPAVPSQPVSSSQSPIQAFEPQPTTGVSSQIGTSGGTTNATSAADLLEELAFGTGAATSSSFATSVPLVVSGADAAGITSSQNQNNVQQNLPPGVSGISQQTFISGDLSWQKDGVASTPPLTGMQAILATMKMTLMRILQYLVPFGARDTVNLDEHGEFEVLE